jgi:hypothetical protein
MFWKLKFITIWVSNSITKFEWKIENKKWLVEAKTLDDREWHLALEMSTLETAHAGRAREITPIKQQQDKPWANNTQQDLPVNVVLNSRLLECKAIREQFYLYAKHVLRVGLYLQVLAIFKSL